MAQETTYKPRLQTYFEETVLPELQKSFGRENRLDLPRMTKIVVNMGVGQAINEKKYLEDASRALAEITGQKAMICRARKSIANFRLREDMAIGCKVTLRGARMWEFFDRLVSLALPRVRDFRGLNPKAFDRTGNYNIGLAEQLVFPELNPDKYPRSQGMNITIVVNGAHTVAESKELLTQLGVPFRQKK